jgi:hypothetical protein
MKIQSNSVVFSLINTYFTFTVQSNHVIGIIFFGTVLSGTAPVGMAGALMVINIGISILWTQMNTG